MKHILIAIALALATAADASVTITLSDAAAQELRSALGGVTPQSATDSSPSVAVTPPLPSNATLVTTNPWNAGFIHAVPQGGVLVLPFVPTLAHPSISYANYAGPPLFRTVTISRTPADFRTALDPSGVNGPVTGKAGAIGLLTPTLTPGVQYYLNIADRVWSTGQPVCRAGATCGDVIVIFK